MAVWTTYVSLMCSNMLCSQHIQKSACFGRRTLSCKPDPLAFTGLDDSGTISVDRRARAVEII